MSFRGVICIMVASSVCFLVAQSGSFAQERNFGEDISFLSKHRQTIVLADHESGARVAVVPAYQGRVMTSTTRGDSGKSYGWINYEQVASGAFSPQISVFGGEDRFWLGPEGGQFSIFFDPEKSFEFANWRTPPLIDSEPFDLVAQSDRRVSFRRQASIVNYSNTKFDVQIDREVILLDEGETERVIGTPFTGLDVVAYETRNQLTNRGQRAWDKGTGMLSVWILGMYKHGDRTTVVIPFRPGSVQDRGPIVNDDYFGKVPPERLIVNRDKNVLFFAADGKKRSKIGLSPKRATGVCGSWDAVRSVLTIVQYNAPGADVTQYVNSKWELQKDPFAGDVINSYNDGPNDSGGVLGPFYELETSSPALALKAGESFAHSHRTIHLEGDREKLNRIAERVLGVGLGAIEKAIELK
jgi:hypothetical protein